ncbi:MAG: hypothetical protein ACK4FR_02750 [Tabrizicola sp.]
MPALNFHPRFEIPIREGWKRQTIRRRRQRAVQAGDLLTLFVGQRTAACRRICPDVRCTDVLEIEIRFGDGGQIDRIVTDGIRVRDHDAFALLDGFEDGNDMAGFFRAVHGPLQVFDGIVIEWAMPRPVLAASLGAGRAGLRRAA